ncbi:unnamed protein product [Bursaphelenchus xylophilus]|uniref:(pine wood nematode) hypothetical protein n=1 Tax=Bursaphelenchus xylophilus TaxID=6326 RepID=A0A1I7SU84_BURXY|nr:unnamed protein product [Bursaphelenchus xylophilus]CAG9107450.1 unnamed protein product [Bursaphelenchus xylophilus]
MAALSSSKLDELGRAISVEEFVKLIDLQLPYNVEHLKLSEFIKYDYGNLMLLDFTESQADYLIEVFDQVLKHKEKKQNPSMNFVNKFCNALRINKDRVDKHESIMKKKKREDYFGSVITDLQSRLRHYVPNEIQIGEEEGFSLVSAVITGHQECIEKMIKMDPKAVNRANSKGWTPLMYSLAQGCSDGTTTLLRAGADPKTTNKDGMNALGLGASYGHRSTLRNFLRFCREKNGSAASKMMINEPDKKGRIALHYAAENRQWEACEVLLNFGADPNLKDKEGNTPMLIACKGKNSATVRAIFTKGGNPEIANNQGETGASLLGEKRRYLIEDDKNSK